MNTNISIPPAIKEWLLANSPKDFTFDLSPSQKVCKLQEAERGHYLLRSCHDVTEVCQGINRCWFHTCSQCGDVWVWWSSGTERALPIKQNVGKCTVIEAWDRASLLMGKMGAYYVRDLDKRKHKAQERREWRVYLKHRKREEERENLRRKVQEEDNEEEARIKRQNFYKAAKPSIKKVNEKLILHGRRTSKKRALDRAALQFHREQDQHSQRQNLMEFVLSEALPQLDYREQATLNMRFGLMGEPHTLEECGKKFGVTREAVRQIQAKALRKLNSFIKQQYHDE
jgi:hypothetical protein